MVCSLLRPRVVGHILLKLILLQFRIRCVILLHHDVAARSVVQPEQKGWALEPGMPDYCYKIQYVSVTQYMKVISMKNF